MDEGTGTVNGNAIHGGKMAWVVLAWVMAAATGGCVSIPYNGKKVYKTPTVTTQTVRAEGVLDFHPEVERKGDVVRLRMVADGMFVEETTTIRRYKVEKLKMGVGLCPGWADYPINDEERKTVTVDGTCSATVCMVMLPITGNLVGLGTPTASGLLIEPFLPAREQFHPFRQSAFVGFGKCKVGEEEGAEKPKITRRTVKKMQSVEQIPLWFDSEPKFWKDSVQDGDALVLRGVEAGRHKGMLYIKSVPTGHLYEKELKKMAWGAIDVEIPE